MRLARGGSEDMAQGSSFPASLVLGGVAVPLIVRRSRTARRLTLRACAPTRSIRLTLPARVGHGQALAFLAAHRDWLEAEVAARLLPPRPFLPGSVVPLAGTPLRLVDAPVRRVVRADPHLLVPAHDPERFNADVMGFLRRQARLLLTAEAERMAASIDRRIAAVRIGDPKSRWGSCSSNGCLSFSWRLILAPGFVRRAVVAHEVAHLVQMNHGPAFHRLAEQLSGAPHGPARAWLKDQGAFLFSLGALA
ncbi:M48 family metallopeptidase [Thermaurantiacus sp.]